MNEDEVQVTLPEETAPRVVTLVGAVDDQSFQRAVDHLAFLCAQSDDPIVVAINSGGGSLHTGWAFYDLLRTQPVPIITVGYGIIASAATLAFLGGHRRYISKHSRLVVHEVRRGTHDDEDITTTSAHESHRELRGLQAQIVSMYVRETGLPKPTIAHWVKKDTDLSARQAIAYGFADGLVPVRYRHVRPHPKKVTEKSLLPPKKKRKKRPSQG